MVLNLDKSFTWILKIYYQWIDLLKNQSKAQNQLEVNLSEEDLAKEAKEGKEDNDSKVEIGPVEEISEVEMQEDLPNQFIKDDKQIKQFITY